MSDVAKRGGLFVIAVATALLCGCGPTYIYGQTAPTTFPAKPPGCAVQLLSQPPDRPYDEVGVFAPKDVAFGSMAGGPVPFQEDIHERVCRAGGDAVVVEKNWASNYIRGTVIRYK